MVRADLLPDPARAGGCRRRGTRQPRAHPVRARPRRNARTTRRDQRSGAMIALPYSLVIEATSDPDFFGFYSPELEGFSGVGHSVEDCLYKALGDEGTRRVVTGTALARPAPERRPYSDDPE